jgi:hypothetical protein
MVQCHEMGASAGGRKYSGKRAEGGVVLEVDSATNINMTYNGIGVISGFALKGVAPFCIHPQTFVPHHV